METTQNPSVPPLDADLNTVETTFPLLANGTYDLRISKAEVKPTATPGGKLIHLELATTIPCNGRKGEQLPAGTRVFENINVVPTGKATWDMITRNVGGFIQAIPGGMPGARLTNVEQWVPQLNGRTVRAEVGYEPAGSKNGKSFPEKNVITGWRKS